MGIVSAVAMLLRCQGSHRSAARSQRISELLNAGAGADLSSAEAKELSGLMSKGDPYDASLHTPSHSAFKAEHNRVFSALLSSCDGEPVFYLDGPDAGTTRRLLEDGFPAASLHSAALFESTAERLRDLVPAENVPLTAAEEALAGTFSRTAFAGYYLDGCSGLAEPIIRMCGLALDGDRPLPKAGRVVIGFTLTVAEPSGRPLPDREQDVTAAVAGMARARGLDMQRVGDHAERWLGEGARPPTRFEGRAQTTWLLLLPGGASPAAAAGRT